jgi:DNA-binding transcriptional LysR family regulator
MLLAFEAVARLGNVTAAANELSLTQGAVSRQIQSLEQQLGIDLFEREKKRVRPTLAAIAYASETRSALEQIARASLKLKANPEGGTLNLAILPTFGTHWLAPRLASFLAQNSGVTVNLNTRLAPFDFGMETFDAAIHYGQPDWPGAEHLKLMNEEVLAVGSPALLAQAGVATAADILRLPLLHLESRADAWEQWMLAHQVDSPPLTGMLFDQFATMCQAAVHGIGIALLPTFLIAKELDDGALAPAFGGPSASSGSYYLVWPRHGAGYAPLLRFADWLRGETGETTPAPIA